MMVSWSREEEEDLKKRSDSLFKPFPTKSLFLYKPFRNEGLDALYPIPSLHVYHVGQFGKTGWSIVIPW